MTHNKEQKENINSFLIQLKSLLQEHNMKFDVPVNLTSLKYGYIGSLENEYGDLYIVDEDTFVELYSTVSEEKNDK